MSNEKILQDHSELYDELIQIPLNRIITYNEYKKDGILIGKPRFRPKEYQWDPKLLSKLRDHLQDIWNYFDSKSYWFDKSLKEILLYNERRLSKKSIMFLLEKDVWCTDEVYGDYLIEEIDGKTQISYYRFNQKFQTFILNINNKEDRGEWIVNDAKSQIIKQFQFLWKKLEIELITCEEETHHKPISYQMDDEYLRSQLIVCEQILSISKEAALLMLGRIQEIFLLKHLKKIKSERDESIFVEAENRGIINNATKKIFWKIRTNYNSLKHTTNYDINSCNILELLNSFKKFIN